VIRKIRLVGDAMKKFIAVLSIPAAIVAALATNVVSVPFDYLRGLFSRPEIGPELHLKIPPNYPAIGGLIVTRTATGTNVDLLGK
jgi:hypothetical protein